MTKTKVSVLARFEFRELLRSFHTSEKARLFLDLHSKKQSEGLDIIEVQEYADLYESGRIFYSLQ